MVEISIKNLLLTKFHLLKIWSSLVAKRAALNVKRPAKQVKKAPKQKVLRVKLKRKRSRLRMKTSLNALDANTFIGKYLSEPKLGSAYWTIILDPIWAVWQFHEFFYGSDFT